MKITKKGYLFNCSGRIMNNDGTASIGLDVTDAGLGVTLGFDQLAYIDGEEMSDEETIELCDFMIAKWTKLKRSVNG